MSRCLEIANQSKPAEPNDRPHLVGLFAPAGYGKSAFVRAYARDFTESTVADCGTMETAAELTAALSNGSPSSLLVVERAERFDDAIWEEALMQAGVARNDGPHLIVVSRRDLALDFTSASGPDGFAIMRKLELSVDVAALKKAHGDRVGALDIERIAKLSLGWPYVASALAGIAARGLLDRPFDEPLGAPWRDLYDWIEANVVRGLPAPAFETLLRCTVCVDAYGLGDCRSDPFATSDIRSLQQLQLVDVGPMGEFRVPPILQWFLRARHSEELVRAAFDSAELLAKIGERTRAARVYVNAGNLERAATLVPAVDEEAQDLANYAYPGEWLETIGSVKPPYALYPSIWYGLLTARLFVTPTKHLIAEALIILESRELSRRERFLLVGSLLVLFALDGDVGAASERFAELRTYAGQADGPALDIAEFFLASAKGDAESALALWKRAGTACARNPAMHALVLRTASRLTMQTAGPLQALEILESMRAVAWGARAPLMVASAALGQTTLSWILGDLLAYRTQLRIFQEVVRAYDVPLLAGAAALLAGVDDAGEGPADGAAAGAASMIAAVDAEDPQRRKALAVAAVARADAAEVNWLRPISRLVASLCVPERGPEFLFQAKVLADRMPALLRIIAAVEEGQPDAKYLRHAVDRLRAPNDTTGAAAPQNESVSLDFYRQNAYRGGSTVSLSRGPEALLLFLAVHPGLNKADSLTDALWPELDGDHAFSALKACAHRLRAQSGEPAILVVEDGQWRAGAAIASSYAAWGGKLKELSLQMVAEAGHIGGPERAALRLDFDRLAARERRWSRWAWYASFEQTTAGVFQHLGQLLARDALARQEPAEALEIAQAMSADAPSAEDPVRLIIQSLQMLDRPALAIAAYERFRADARALGLEPTGRLEQLVRSA